MSKAREANPGAHERVRGRHGAAAAAAAAIDRETRPLAQQAAAFHAQERAVDAAFGLVGASDEVYNAYISKLNEFVAGLGNLKGGLGAVAGGLRGDADVYDEADALTAPGKL